MKRGATLTASGAMLLFAAAASAQHTDDYETPPYVAAPVGVIITGQPPANPFYLPVVDSNDGLVFTYAGNALGIPANPGGGVNFVGTTEDDPDDPDGVPFIRAQQDVDYPVNSTIKVGYDVLVTKIGSTSTSDNIGSWSSQVVPGGSVFGYIDLFQWLNPADTTQGFIGSMVWFDAADVQLTEQIGEYTGLSLDTWYRRYNFYDFGTNEIVKLVMVDLATGTQIVHKPVQTRYADGGAGGGVFPTGFRYFVGCIGGTCSAGNTLAWDNLAITCQEDIDEDLDIGFPDLLIILNRWNTDDALADLDGDQDVGFGDLLLVLAAWGKCS